MAIKKLFLLILTLIFCVQTAFLQAKNQQDYFLHQNPDGITEIRQKLVWDSANYIRRYEVFIEKKTEKGIFAPFGTYTTEINSIELALPAGEYRYKVNVYNLLNKIAYETPYTEFFVQKAFLPKLNDISPSLIYLDEIDDDTFTVRGLNLFSNSIFTLEKGIQKITPNSALVAPNGRSATLNFLTERFDTGVWHLKVENQGGFSSEIPLDIRFFKWYDITIQAGYKPFFVLYDDTIKTYFGTSMSLLGAEAKTTFVPYKRRFGYFGFGVDFMYHKLSNNFGNYTLGANILQGYLFFVYRLPIIKNRLLLNAQAGPGVFAMQGLTFTFGNALHSEPFNAVYVSFLAGISLHIFVYKKLYIDVGADYTMPIMTDMNFMTIMPSLSVGVQL